MRLLVLTAFAVGCATDAEVPFLEEQDLVELQLGVPLQLEMHATSDRVELLASGAPAGAWVWFARSAQGEGAGPCPQQLGGQCVDLVPPLTLARRVRADADGVAFVDLPKPADGTAWQAVVAAGAASRLSQVRTWTPLACEIFPTNNPWNTDISAYPLHARSTAFVDSVGRTTRLHADFGTFWAGAPNGIPFVEVEGDQALVPIGFGYSSESDPGPYPIPPDPPIEGGPQGNGDRHVLVVDRDACELWETWNTWPLPNGNWTAGSGAFFDLSSNGLRPDGWTSADAAGLPIYPGLVKYEEVAAGVVDHALRFTIGNSQAGFVHPATHAASPCSPSQCPNDPPMGARFRMRATYDCSALSTEVQVLCVAMKRYGMFVADNGSDWYVSGAPDPRWDDSALADLARIPGDAFEVVDTGPTLQ